MEETHQQSLEEVDHYKRVMLDASTDKKLKNRQNGFRVLERQVNSYTSGEDVRAVMLLLFLGIVVNWAVHGYCTKLVHLGFVHILCGACRLQWEKKTPTETLPHESVNIIYKEEKHILLLSASCHLPSPGKVLRGACMEVRTLRCLTCPWGELQCSG